MLPAQEKTFLYLEYNEFAVQEMLKNRNVIILGAGASVPYGYPDGPKLIQDIISFQEEVNNDIHFINNFNDVSRNTMDKFFLLLKSNVAESIDEVISQRQDFAEIAKYLIIKSICPYENSHIVTHKSDWIEYIFHHFQIDFQDLFQKRLVFLTFNYDRTLEYYLFNKLIHFNKMTEEDACYQLDQVPISHLHGVISNLKINKYGKPIPTKAMCRFAYNLNTIYDDTKNTIWNDVREALAEADNIFILGLSYHDLNMRKLFRNLHLKNPLVLGTGFNMTTREIQRKKVKFPFLEIYQGVNCIDFFRDKADLI